MPRYAPGTSAYDRDNQRRADSARMRQENWASGLMGANSLFNSIAGVNQRNQAYADQQAAMPYMVSAYGNPTGALEQGQEGPMQSPFDAAAAAAGRQQNGVSSFLGNLGMNLNPFQARQGNITPQALQQISQIQSQQVAQRRAAALSPLEIQHLQLQNSGDQQAQDFAAQTQPLQIQGQQLRNQAAQQDVAFNDVMNPVRFAGAKLGNAAAQQGIEQRTEMQPLDIQAKKAQIDETRANLAMAPDRANLLKSQAREANARADNPAGTRGGVRYDILAGKKAEAYQKLAALRDMFEKRLAAEGGDEAADTTLTNIGYKDPRALATSNALYEMWSRQLDDVRALNTGGAEQSPPPEAAPTQGGHDIRPVNLNQPQQSASGPLSTDEANFARKYANDHGWDPKNITPEQEGELMQALGRQGAGGR